MIVDGQNKLYGNQERLRDLENRKHEDDQLQEDCDGVKEQEFWWKVKMKELKIFRHQNCLLL